MPEIGECYSIADSIPELGEMTDIKVSTQAKAHIIKDNQNFLSLKGSFFHAPFAYGKSVCFPLEYKNKLWILCSQLGMTGSWFLDDHYLKRGHDHVIMTFKNGRKLRYSDPRMFGKMKIYSGKDKEEILNKIIEDHKWGIDPIKSEEEDISAQLFKLLKSSSEIKKKLLEQNLICGVGNYLASEILYESQIHPQTSCKDLSESDLLLMAQNIKSICIKAHKYKGHSFAGGYILPDGTFGTMNEHIIIYGKKLCPKKHNVQEIYINERVTYFCPVCQKKK